MRLQDRDIKSFGTKDLHYLSVWWLNAQTYGMARLSREITDAWISKKWSLGGVAYSTEAPELSEQEIDAIPGAKASMGQWDSIAWEVLERTSSGMTIRSDEDKYWRAQGGLLGEQYETLKAQHQQLIATQPAAQERPSKEDEAASRSTGAAGGDEEATTMESFAKLEEALGIKLKVTSELSNVELALCKDDSLWIISQQDKLIAKHATIGGYGTGQWVSQEDPEPGIDFVLDGDHAIIQLDEPSFNPEGQGVATMTMFKLLLRAEKEKGLNDHRISFCAVHRKNADALEAGTDGFEIKVKAAMKFKFLKDPRAGQEDRVTSKNFFAKCVSSVTSSEHICKVFRFRFEKVGANFKVQRPYVLTTKALQLKKDIPMKLSK